MSQQKNLYNVILPLFIILIGCIFIAYNDYKDSFYIDDTQVNQEINDNTLKIISSSENKDMEDNIRNYAKSQGIDVLFEYAGTLDIMEKLNMGEKYDAVWTSNSIWLYMLNKEVSILNSKSTSTNPVVFAIKESKAQELGFKDKEIYTSDIISSIKNGKLKFSMSNPTQTNSGATAYLGLLSSIVGSPEVLKLSDIENENVKSELISLFTGLERSSGSEEFLEELFINGSYEAVVTYESSIININKKLSDNKLETLYALYPIDGVSISDSPFAYIDNGNENKKENFEIIQNYILSSEGQKELERLGRRTWYGGVNPNADKNVFNPNWGIDTNRYIVPIKFPNTEVIQNSLALYQSELRKPVHTIFCLDYSGSMIGEGNSQLVEAMEYILTEQNAKKDLLQFTEKDKITVIPFSTYVLNTWNAENGLSTDELINDIKSQTARGSTNIYEPTIKALEILNKEDLSKYNVSVVLMTDGQSNLGKYSEFEKFYNSNNKQIPIYSIMFGDAYEKELQELANLTNGKTFDGKTDLLKAFKEVRGYN